MPGSPGAVHLKIPLGPDRPALTRLRYGSVADHGVALATAQGTAGVEIATGDPAFDSRHRLAAAMPDPQPVLAVVNPAVRRMILEGLVHRRQIGGRMWLVVGYERAEQRDACTDWTRRLATLVVTASGLPVVPPGPGTTPAR